MPTTDNASHYVGRFAPSPTGPLHMGSLVAALASFLDARAAGGRWLLRIEDLDPPRESPQAAIQIIRSLRSHGLQWDGDVTFQHMRGTIYESALQRLARQGLLFRCACSRTQLEASGGLHHGICRSTSGPFALRVAVDDSLRCFDDRLQGRICERLDNTAGDFIVKRKEGLYAYQLAVVVDDAAQQVTHVVRGSDLIDSTLRQIYLQQCLGLPEPVYMHIPVLTSASGQKLSKQNLAPAIDNRQACDNLRTALRYLQQAAPPPHISDVSGVLAFAVAHWRPDVIPRCHNIPA
jgi:glutamyl-Q tRNA(Asp) synthetase